VGGHGWVPPVVGCHGEGVWWGVMSGCPPVVGGHRGLPLPLVVGAMWLYVGCHGCSAGARDTVGIAPHALSPYIRHPKRRPPPSLGGRVPRNWGDHSFLTRPPSGGRAPPHWEGAFPPPLPKEEVWWHTHRLGTTVPLPPQAAAPEPLWPDYATRPSPRGRTSPKCCKTSEVTSSRIVDIIGGSAAAVRSAAPCRRRAAAGVAVLLGLAMLCFFDAFGNKP
jgi:hypothetical protein